MSEILTLGLIITAVGLVACFAWRKLHEAHTLRKVRTRFAGVEILACAPDAHFKGMDRSWDNQWRGRGVLIMTREVLYFQPWQKGLDLSIPLDKVQEASVVSIDRGLRPRRGAFRVSYLGLDGQRRLATWTVKSCAEWDGLVQTIPHGDGGHV